MTWRSPFQTTKGGGVPFPALTPWANSPAPASDVGSPMQTSPTPLLRSLVTRGTTRQQKTSVDKASPMDAAPYTPLSARQGPSVQVPNTTGKFVGKLSFTPHVSHQRQARFSPVSRTPPVASTDQRSSSSNKSLAQPPQTSLYTDTANSQPAASRQSMPSGMQV